MGKLENNTYIKPNATKQWLLSHNFHYNSRFSDDESEIYTYRFPAYKYGGFTILECELYILLGEDQVRINVYDYETYDRYAPFYYCNYGNYDTVLKIIWKNIDKQLNVLGIIKNKENADRSKSKAAQRKRNYNRKRKQ